MSDGAEEEEEEKEREGGREGDGIYNIYVSSAIRRCFLASLRLRRRRRTKRARIMVTSVRRPRLVSLRLSVSLVSVPRNECCNQTENEEGRNGGREGGGFGAYSMTLLAAGRKDGRTEDRRTDERRDASLPHLLPEDDDWTR